MVKPRIMDLSALNLPDAEQQPKVMDLSGLKLPDAEPEAKVMDISGLDHPTPNRSKPSRNKRRNCRRTLCPGRRSLKLIFRISLVPCR